MLNFDNDIIHVGGWRIKRHYETWLTVDHINPVLFKTGTNNPVCVYNHATNTEYVVSSQREASAYTGLSEGIISIELSRNTQRILPGLWSFKRPINKWFIVVDKWIKYENDNGVKPVICTYPNGTKTIFENIAKCSKSIGVGVTTIYYRLSNNKTTVGRNGYAFEYYSNSVRCLGN